MNEKNINTNSVKCEFLKEDNDEYNLKYKIIMVGDSGVGKTCITYNAAKNKFNDVYNSTIGFDFFNINIKIKDCIMKFQVWDTCGQERFSSMISKFYKNSIIAIIVYSITE